MLKVRGWVGIFTAPILLASVGCSIGPRSVTNNGRGLPPERLMSMARTLERQGHLSQAKTAYAQVLASNPNYPNARNNLEMVIAAESRQGVRPGQGNPIVNSVSGQAMMAANSAQPKVPKIPSTRNVDTATATSTEDGLKLLASTSETRISVVHSDSEVRSIVDNSSKSNFVSDSPRMIGASAEGSTEFLSNKEQEQLAVGDGLEQFLGPFHIEMVDYLKLNRERLQPRLVELAANRNCESDLRTRAVFLLGSIGQEASDALPMLREELNQETDPFLRVDLAEAILKIHPGDEGAISVLIGSLKHPENELKQTAAFALRNAAKSNSTFVIDALVDSLQTEDQKLRRMIFLTLAEFGSAARRVIPEVEAALTSPDPATREVAKATLACIALDNRTTKTVPNSTNWNVVLKN